MIITSNNKRFLEGYGQRLNLKIDMGGGTDFLIMLESVSTEIFFMEPWNSIKKII